MEVLEEVNQIIEKLQEGKWSDHSPQLLESAQGKLSALQTNVSKLVCDARKEMNTRDIHVKNKEATQFLEYRKHKMSVEECKMNARVDVLNDLMKGLDAKAKYNDLKGVLDAMQTLTIAVQVTIREQGRELSASKYQNNA